MYIEIYVLAWSTEDICPAKTRYKSVFLILYDSEIHRNSEDFEFLMET